MKKLLLVVMMIGLLISFSGVANTQQGNFLDKAFLEQLPESTRHAYEILISKYLTWENLDELGGIVNEIKKYFYESGYKNGFNVGFNSGKVYQIGWVAGILGTALPSRQEREQTIPIFISQLSNKVLLEQLHKEFERGYIDGSQKRRK